MSEILRDIDLFVSVSSVANDQQWSPDPTSGPFGDYRANYSLGELTATAYTRKDVLAWLIPKLNLTERCRLEGRHLFVHGDLRDYKIHLGSGNAFMEPSDMFLDLSSLNIERSKKLKDVFLPFDDDRTLSLILFRALTLMDDRAIKDTAIREQIKNEVF